MALGLSRLSPLLVCPCVLMTRVPCATGISQQIPQYETGYARDEGGAWSYSGS